MVIVNQTTKARLLLFDKLLLLLLFTTSRTDSGLCTRQTKTPIFYTD
jgi:hypothetical protein